MIRNAMWFVVGVLFAIGLTARSGPYVGGSVSRTWQSGLGDVVVSDYSPCASIRYDQISDTVNLFIGYRFKYVGAEFGGGSLFKSSFMGECPWASGGQTLAASHNYGRMNVYIQVKDLELVPFVGVARVKHTNHEEFVMGDSPEFAPGTRLVNHTTGTTASLLYGLGIQKSFERWFFRLEYQRMERVAEDYWTARGFHNSLDTMRLAVGYEFGRRERD